jgi:hypothetical protein
METGSDDPSTAQGGPAAACRGGIILLLGSLLGMIVWSFPVMRSHSDHGPLALLWPMTTWLVFPLGAWLGGWLPARVRGRRLLPAGSIGLLAGIAAGLLLSLAMVASLHYDELWGLISNRGSGGYASYRVSVLQSLQRDLGQTLQTETSIMAIVVLLWALGETRRQPAAASIAHRAADPWALRLSFTHIKIPLVIAGGLTTFGALMALVGRVPVDQVLLVAVVAFGTVFLGPWMGPIVNPGAATGGFALRETALGATMLLLSLVPFLLPGRFDRPGRRTLAWCGYVTALLFWVYLGVLCLGHSLG